MGGGSGNFPQFFAGKMVIFQNCRNNESLQVNPLMLGYNCQNIGFFHVTPLIYEQKLSKQHIIECYRQAGLPKLPYTADFRTSLPKLPLATNFGPKLPYCLISAARGGQQLENWYMVPLKLPLWVTLRSSWAILGHLGVVLGSSWVTQWSSWVTPQSSWGHPWSPWGYPG